jgi:hypothetical protein
MDRQNQPFNREARIKKANGQSTLNENYYAATDHKKRRS